MENWKKSKAVVIAACALALLCLTGCANQQETQKPVCKSSICAENELVSYTPIDREKTIVTIGRYTVFNSEPLERALEQKFPGIDIVSVNVAGSNNTAAYLAIQAEQGDLPDIVFGGMKGNNEYFYDLSAESFTSRYNLSALESLTIDGKLPQLPVSSITKGIFYNKTLFEEHGWEIPATLDEFYALCETIAAEGIRPFVPCLKYSVQEVGVGLTNRELLDTAEKRAQFEGVVNGTASCEGLLEPYYQTLRTLYETGIVVEEDFDSSLTKNRQALYAGEIAMLPSTLAMYNLYEEENPDCEIDYFGYPTDTPNERWMQMVSGVTMGFAQQAMDDPEKKDILLEIADYLSTYEGQEVLIGCFGGVSSVKSYQENIQDELWDVKNCLQKGQIYFAHQIGQVSDFSTAFDWMRGSMSMEEIIAATDDFEPIANAVEPEVTTCIGVASENFTSLETSCFEADVMREATGAEIALMLHNQYYKGNSGKIYQGDITLPDRFYLRSVSSEDPLTVYEISGANLKKLMERPLVNGAEVNATYAPSGLKMEYAPWRDAGENVLSLTLADGSEIEDEKIYTVAAWASTVDESFISSVKETFPDLGTNVDLMTAALGKAGEVSPPKDGRITLVWD